jgi:hypothetical protein
VNAFRGRLSFVKSTRFLPNPSSTNKNHLRAERSTQENPTMTSRIFDADEYFGVPDFQNTSIDPRGFRRLSGDERTRSTLMVLSRVSIWENRGHTEYSSPRAHHSIVAVSCQRMAPSMIRPVYLPKICISLTWPGAPENQLTIHRHLNSTPPLWPSRLCRITL